MPTATDPSHAIVVVANRYPALGAPDLAYLLKGLEERGQTFEIWTLSPQGEGRTHPVHAEVRARVRHVPPRLTSAPLRVARATLRAAGLPGFVRALSCWLGDLAALPGPERLRLLGQACVVATESGAPVGAFLGDGTGAAGHVARLAATLCGRPWVYRAVLPDFWALSERARASLVADSAICIAPDRSSMASLSALLPGRDRVVLAHPAVDLGTFAVAHREPHEHRGATHEQPLRLVSVGRLEEGFGHADLLAALADLPRALHWQLLLIGDGSAAGRLRQLALDLKLGARVRWGGPRTHAEVLANLREADIYVQCPRPEPVGARNGLPHAVIEAASQGLPVISTRVAGVSGFLVDDENAVLVRAGQRGALTDAIHRLAGDPDTRARLGAAGRLRVEAAHGLAHLVDDIAPKLKAAAALRR